MRDNLRESGINFGKKGIGGLRAALEIPIEGSVNLFPSLEPDTEGLLCHRPSRARHGAFTSSHE